MNMSSTIPFDGENPIIDLAKKQFKSSGTKSSVTQADAEGKYCIASAFYQNKPDLPIKSSKSKESHICSLIWNDSNINIGLNSSDPSKTSSTSNDLNAVELLEPISFLGKPGETCTWTTFPEQSLQSGCVYSLAKKVEDLPEEQNKVVVRPKQQKNEKQGIIGDHQSIIEPQSKEKQPLNVVQKLKQNSEEKRQNRVMEKSKYDQHSKVVQEREEKIRKQTAYGIKCSKSIFKRSLGWFCFLLPTSLCTGTEIPTTQKVSMVQEVRLGKRILRCFGEYTSLKYDNIRYTCNNHSLSINIYPDQDNCKKPECAVIKDPRYMYIDLEISDKHFSDCWCTINGVPSAKKKIVDIPIVKFKGQWENWGNWSDCSKTCGGGIMNRSRLCLMPDYADLKCDGNKTESKECNIGNCTDSQLWIIPAVVVPVFIILLVIIFVVIYKRKRNFREWISPLFQRNQQNHPKEIQRNGNQMKLQQNRNEGYTYVSSRQPEATCVSESNHMYDLP